MVNNKREDIVKRPTRQGPEEVIAEPNRIGASTPCDFEAKNLTAYGGLLPVATMLEKLRFQQLLEETLTVKRVTRAMPMYHYCPAKAHGPIGKLYHMGFHGRVSRSTLADANDAHDWRIYADFAQVLIRIARPLYASDPIGVDLDQSLYALDSTTIDLCLALFPWAKFREHKAAVKMHTLLDLHGNI